MSVMRCCERLEASPLLRGACLPRRAVAFQSAACSGARRQAAPAQFNDWRPLLLTDAIRRQGQRQSTIAQAKKGGGKSDSKASSGGSDKKGGGKSLSAAAASGDETAQIMAKAKAEAEDRMKKCLAVLSDNFSTIRTGRASPAILDRVVVDYFGTPTPLKQIAAISVPDAFTLLLSPFDKASLKEIEKALNESDVGLTPNNDGEKIRLGLPQLTQDRRKELVKAASKMGEDGKVAVRNVRKDAMKKADKLDLSKDGAKALEDDIQKLTDVYIKKLEEMTKTKSDEVMKL